MFFAVDTLCVCIIEMTIIVVTTDLIHLLFFFIIIRKYRILRPKSTFYKTRPSFLKLLGSVFFEKGLSSSQIWFFVISQSINSFFLEGVILCLLFVFYSSTIAARAVSLTSPSWQKRKSRDCAFVQISDFKNLISHAR